MTYFQTPLGSVYRSYNDEPYNEGDVKLADGKRLYAAQLADELRSEIPPGTTIYTVLRSVSASGMRRRISLFYVSIDRRPVSLDWHLANISSHYKLSKDGGIIVNGCGQDMGFALVYDLGRLLWPNGTPEPHGTRNGEPDSDGGYALKHAWI